jgi:hypothetical protein
MWSGTVLGKRESDLTLTGKTCVRCGNHSNWLESLKCLAVKSLESVFKPSIPCATVRELGCIWILALSPSALRIIRLQYLKFTVLHSFCKIKLDWRSVVLAISTSIPHLTFWCKAWSHPHNESKSTLITNCNENLLTQQIQKTLITDCNENLDALWLAIRLWVTNLNQL